MEPYPHTYLASARAYRAGWVTVASPRVADLDTAAPPQFGGPDNAWSPETLLCASLADCFILTFRALSRAARFSWNRLECDVEGVLERVDGVSQFTHYTTRAKLLVPRGADIGKALDLLEKAEKGCLIANSLRGTRSVETEVLEAEPSQTDSSSALIDDAH